MAVKCPKCQAENTDTAKFCSNCATHLPSGETPRPEVTETLHTPIQELTTGSTFAGRYQIIEELGHGGMGVVHKARDIRLDRFAAIKVLPRGRVADSERKLRFIQEAKAASALNHPNIVLIYDIEQAEGIDFIAMEFVDGRTLDEVIGRKGLKLSEALKFAVQVADALATAHEVGIVHRDLKPGNVMVTGKGQVKVLDFGLAKLTEILPAGEADATRTLKPTTEEGRIVGTVAYMSPEQAEGKKVDARSDIFSFGSVFYEMITGKRAFHGESGASTLAAILKENPKPAGQLVEGLPKEIERLISRCLRKDISQRFQHMDDVKIALEELKEESDSGALAAARPAAQARRSLFPKLAAIAVIALGLAAVIWLWLGRSHRVTPEVPITAIPLVTYPGEIGSPTFSPDGNEIAFDWNGKKQDNSDIYRQLIGPGEPLRLTTDPAEDFSPAWSPDSRSIAFLRRLDSGIWAASAVYLIPALGGPERRLAEVAGGVLGCGAPLAWSPDSKWLAIGDREGPGQPFGICLVSAETGEKKRLTSPPVNTLGDDDASFSPDGQALAFVRYIDLGLGDVYRISLTGQYQPVGEPERLTYENQETYSPVWTSGGKEILYSVGRTEATGRVVRRILLSKPKGPSGYPKVQEPFGEDATKLAVSSVGRRLAYARVSTDSNIYRVEVLDKSGRVALPQKFISSTRNDATPAYSPDGKTIAFSSFRSGTEEIWLCDADGSNQHQLTSMGGPVTGSQNWSPDGKMIAFDSRKEGSCDIFLISPSGGPARRLTSNPGTETMPRWSRDGKWVYFLSVPGGLAAYGKSDEVWKIPIGAGEAVQVTKNGGGVADESPDGKWLYYSKPVANIITLWRMAIGGGEERQFHPGPLDGFVDFAVVDDGIYFTQSDGNLEFIDFASGKTRTMIHVDKPWGWGLSISPDRRWILITLIDQSLNELMLVENFR